MDCTQEALLFNVVGPGSNSKGPNIVITVQFVQNSEIYKKKESKKSENSRKISPQGHLQATKRRQFLTSGNG